MQLAVQRPENADSGSPVRGDHAIVVGGSMSGLLAARVLVDHFAQVTILERDVLSAEGQPRPGVPQARHGHVLLPRGSQVMEQLFPGLLAELVALGVPVADRLDQLHVELNGHVLFRDGKDARAQREPGAGRLYQPTRPFLEARVRERVWALPNVAFMEGCNIEGLATDARRTRVTGVRFAPRCIGRLELDLAADLVVAATGRNGRTIAWLKQMGYAPPSAEGLRVDLKYVTQRVRLPAGGVDGLLMILVGRPTGGFAIAQENGHWIVTSYGYAGHHPPTDRSAWLTFGDAFMPRGFSSALRRSEPVEDLHEHRFPATVRRRFEYLDRFPAGFLITGDALCSFNPIYGQGRTVAALSALALRDSLRGGWERLAHRFFAAAAKPIGQVWRLAVGSDLALPAAVVPGPRPLGVQAMNGYVDRVQAAAEHDPVLTWRYYDVMSYLAPLTALFSPDSVLRVALDSRTRRRKESKLLARELKQAWP